MEPINYYPFRVVANTMKNKILQKDAKVACVLSDLHSCDLTLAYAYSAEVKSHVKNLIPLNFIRCPLNPVQTGQKEYPEYTLSKLILEAMPDYHIPVHLYQPSCIKKSHPAIVVPLGHYIAGVSTPEHQIMCANLAMQGFIVITHDPTGQGERAFFPGKKLNPKQEEYAATDAHMYAALPLYMLDFAGNLTSFFMWENIRLLDFLCSLDYVDKSRLGVTGQSGGGAMTQLLGVIEDRFSAVSPIQASGKSLFGINYGVGDAEQNPHRLNEKMTIEATDLMWAIFPKKLMLNLDVEASGVSHGYLNQEMSRLYGLTKNAEGFEMHIANCGHVISHETRMIAYKWFNKIFMNQTDGILEKHITPLSSEDLRCFPPGFKTKNAYIIAGDILKKERAKQPAETEALREKIKDVLGGYIDGYTLDIISKTNYILHTEKNHYVMCKTQPGEGQVLKVVIDSQGDIPISPSKSPVLQLLPFGLFLSDKKDLFDWDAVTVTAIASFSQGKTIFRERLIQVITAINHEMEKTGSTSIVFEASRQGALLAICAAFYVKTDCIKTYKCLKSFDKYFENIDYSIDESVIMPGLVNICDIPKLAELTGTDVEFICPVDEKLLYDQNKKESAKNGKV